MTPAQLRLLRTAERCRDKSLDGACAKGPTLRAADTLTRAGLLRYVGWGVEVESDDGDEREQRIYEITEAGRAALLGIEEGR